jgi:AcrR family transcriptional regulator
MSSRQEPPSAPATGGREAQRRRTRAAIVAATRGLVADGRTPSIDEIAAAAEVSRRTIYLHFPTLDQLLLDATAGLLSGTIDERLDHDRHEDDVLARTDALARALIDVAPTTLPLGRKIIALTVESPPEPGATTRGYRRVEWVQRALEPARDRLSPERYERLVSALAVVLGWESLIVLRDVRGLSPADEEATLRWAARVLVQAALDEGEGEK